MPVASGDAVKSGGVEPNGTMSPVTCTGAPTIEFVRSRSPVVVSTYWLGFESAPDALLCSGSVMAVLAPSAANRHKLSPSDKNRQLTARIGQTEHRVK